MEQTLGALLHSEEFRNAVVAILLIRKSLLDSGFQTIRNIHETHFRIKQRGDGFVEVVEVAHQFCKSAELRLAVLPKLTSQTNNRVVSREKRALRG